MGRAGKKTFGKLGTGDAALKAYRSGTHRTVSPAETLARVRSLMGRMGITRIANVTGLDRIGVPVVMVCRPNSRSIAVSQGKGLDLDAAKASGVMEAAEVYHAESIASPLKLCSYEEIHDTHRLIDFDGLPLLAGRRFDPNRPILWIEGQDLMVQEPTWARPTSWCIPTTPCRRCPVPGALTSAPMVWRRATMRWKRSATASARSWSGTPRAFGTRQATRHELEPDST
jgi:ribosomal protein S12 methylthiotransferase accessory factor YcaO